MSNFDDKNLFDDDFDLLSESADNLFGPKVDSTPKKEEKTENNNNEILEQNPQNEEEIKVEETTKKSKKSTKKNNQNKDEDLTEQQTQISSNNVDNQLEDTNNFEDTKNYDEASVVDGSNNIEPENNSVKNKKENNSKKEEKAKKQKGKNKLVIILVVVAVIIFALVVSGLVLYLKKVNTKLATPTYEIYQRDVGTIINIDKVDNALGYEITLSKNGMKDATFKSTSNIVEVKSFLNKAGEFSVKIRALGKTDKATSDYSEIKSVVNNIALDTPNLFRDGNIISWNPVAKAVKYNVYYGVNFDNDTVNFKEVEQNNNLISFDLTTLNEYGAGAYPIYVQAITNEQYYLNSQYSKTIVYEYYEKTQQALQPKFDLSSNKLMFMLYENQYIPNSCLVEFLVEKSGNDNSHIKIKHLIMLAELENIKTTYNSQNVIKYVADFKELIDGEIINITITSMSDGNYLQNSDKIIVVVE